MAALPVSLFTLPGRSVGELAAIVNSGATSFSVKSGQGSKFAASDFWVRVDAEPIHVVTRTSDLFTVDATGSPHQADAPVYECIAVETPLLQWIYDNFKGHTHAKSEISDFSHSHAQGDVTDLAADLTARQLTSQKGAVNGYASLDAGGKVPSAQLPASGSDPWTIAALASDFTTSSASAVDVGLGFAPAANTRYMFEAVLGIRTATATVNPRVGLAWATGMSDGIAQIDESQTATTRLMSNGNINAALLVAVGGIPNTTQSWPVTVWGWVRAGASPSGSVRIQLASETAGTVVRAVAHSYLRYRTY